MESSGPLLVIGKLLLSCLKATEGLLRGLDTEAIGQTGIAGIRPHKGSDLLLGSKLFQHQSSVGNVRRGVLSAIISVHGG